MEQISISNEYLITYRRREIYSDDLPLIKETILTHYQRGRTAISRELCIKWNWKQLNGRLKDYACRLLLLKLQALGHIELPLSKNPGINLRRLKRARETFDIDESPMEGLNTRFLILPWVKIPHLASKLLSLNCKRLSDDWKSFYNHPIYLIETFVDTSRFQGTCYKAANWKHIGNIKMKK